MICEVNKIPYTKNGKKCEVAIKKILRGESVDSQTNVLLDGQSLSEYISYAESIIAT